MARDLVRAIQDARKEAEFNVEDRIEINISPLSNSLPKGERIAQVLSSF